MDGYDPFAPGGYPVGERTIEARDTQRNRVFPCEIWYPAMRAGRDAAAAGGTYPLVVFSHFSGGGRRSSAFLCAYLSSHGYVVAALDHSEVVAPELAARAGESAAERAARAQAWIASRVPDVRFLLDYLLSSAWDSQAQLDPARIGIAGHSFGGWTALAAPAEEPRIGAVVALAPGGASRRKPGILPLQLTFAWGRDVPALYLVAEDDVSLPLAGMVELFERTPATKQMVVLRRADHLHFVDDVEAAHERVRAMTFEGELAWLTAEMRPVAELCSGEDAHRFTRGLALCHLDATLRRSDAARRLLHDDLEAELARRGLDAYEYRA